MSAWTGPVPNMANAPTAVPSYGRSWRRQPLDPQVGLLLNQMTEGWAAFSYVVSQKLADRAMQQSQLAQAAPIPVDEKGAGERTVEGESLESVEMRWLVENSRALEDYRGEWLLIVGRELVAHSASFQDIRRAIADRVIDSPFVYYVPTEQESNFILV